MKVLQKHHNIAAFCSTDPTRAVLNGAHAATDYLEAADGKILVRVPYSTVDPAACPAEGQDPAGKIVPAAALKSLAKLKPHPPHLSCAVLTAQGDRLQLTRHDGADNVTAIVGAYANTDVIMPDDHTGKPIKVVLSARVLRTLATWADQHGSKWDGKGNVPITLTFHEYANGDISLKPVGFSVPLADSQKATGVFMPMRVS